MLRVRLTIGTLFAILALSCGPPESYSRQLALADKALIFHADRAAAEYHMREAFRLHDTPEIRLRLGELRKSQGRFDAALDVLQPSDNYQHRALQAEIFQETGRHPAALRILEDLVKDYPDYAFGRHLLGNSYAAAGQRDASMTQFRKAAEIEPGLWISRQNIAVMHFQAGERGPALAELSSMLDDYGSLPSDAARLLFGWLKLSDGEPSVACPEIVPFVRRAYGDRLPPARFTAEQCIADPEQYQALTESILARQSELGISSTRRTLGADVPRD